MFGVDAASELPCAVESSSSARANWQPQSLGHPICNPRDICYRLKYKLHSTNITKAFTTNKSYNIAPQFSATIFCHKPKCYTHGFGLRSAQFEQLLIEQSLKQCITVPKEHQGLIQMPFFVAARSVYVMVGSNAVTLQLYYAADSED